MGAGFSYGFGFMKCAGLVVSQNEMPWTDPCKINVLTKSTAQKPLLSTTRKSRRGQQLELVSSPLE